MQQPNPVPAPRGFTRQTWPQFTRDGILMLEDVLPESQVQRLNAALEEHPESSAQNVVESAPGLTEMVGYPSHMGYVHDVYGEIPKPLPRPDEADPERDEYPDSVPLALRKRSTWLEREGLL